MVQVTGQLGQPAVVGRWWSVQEGLDVGRTAAGSTGDRVDDERCGRGAGQAEPCRAAGGRPGTQGGGGVPVGPSAPVQAPAGVRLPFEFVRVHGDVAYVSGHGPLDGDRVLYTGRVERTY